MTQSGNSKDFIAARVSAARKAAGLSQEDLGRRLGLTKAGYGHYERGRQPFSVEQLFTLSQVLGCSVPFLLGLETSLKPDEDTLLELYRQARQHDLGDLVLRTVRAIVGPG